MTTETYAIRIRRELVLNGYGMTLRNHRKLARYLRRAIYGSRPGVLGRGQARYKAAAKAAFVE